MATATQRSFAGGEIDPALYARADTVKYATGLKTCRNFYVMKHGGVCNRPGTQFIAEVRDGDNPVRLIEFVFSDDQAYVLEFGHHYMRVIQNGGLLTVGTPAAWANSTAYTYGQVVSHNGTNWSCKLNHTSTLAYAPILGSAYWHPMTGDTYEVYTPYDEGLLQLLQFVQSADVMTIACEYASVYELARLGQTQWAFSAVAFEPAIQPPSNLTGTGTVGEDAKLREYLITSAKKETYEESYPALLMSGESGWSFPVDIAWDEADDAQEYYIYRADNGVFGYIGTAQGTSFEDIGYTPDFSETPPEEYNPFYGPWAPANASSPGAVTYYQQRLIFSGGRNRPETLFCSQVGNYHNFTLSHPAQDDDAFSFSLAGRKLNAIRYLMDLDGLVIFTASSILVAQGDADGALRPTAINVTNKASTGAANVAPVEVGNGIIYVQARGSVVRDFGRTVSEDGRSAGYAGNDLTVFAYHLFENHKILDLAYQETPHSIIWAVRDDGSLLGLTYLREHEVWGWHRHDTDGYFEDVCTIPEGNQDSLYTVVRRTINGETKRYIERLAPRTLADPARDSRFLDSHLSYSGRPDDFASNPSMTLSGGTDWSYREDLTLTAGAGYFVEGDVGNEIHLYLLDDLGEIADTLRVRILSVTSATVAIVRPAKDVPAELRGVAAQSYGLAVDQLGNLDHLEGKTVHILADGSVETPQVVTGGEITLQKPAVIIHVGLPIEAEIETLSLENASGQSLVTQPKLINKVWVKVKDSRGFMAGPDRNQLYAAKVRSDEAFGETTRLQTGDVEVGITAKWDSNGRVLITQPDPLPLTILSVTPSGVISS